MRENAARLMHAAQITGLAGSFLGDLDGDTLDELLDASVLLEFERGAAIFKGPPQPRVGVLLEGIARAYLGGPGGRQLTVRHVRPRSSLSTVTSGAAQNAIPIHLEAVSDVTVIEFDYEVIVGLQRSRPDLLGALAAETQRRLSDVYRAFAANFFGTVRERLAAHLLESAEDDARAGLTAPVTQQQLAQALGTAREVVSRTLQQLQAAGIVAVRRGGITITDVHRLVGETGHWGIPSRVFAVDPMAGADQSFDSAPQPVIAIDSAGDIVYANPRVVATFGWQPRELIGRPVTELLPTDAEEHLRNGFARLMDNVAAGPMGLGGDYHGQRADGSEFPAEITILPVQHGGSTIVFVTVVDVTYRSVLRARLQRHGMESGARSRALAAQGANASA